MSDKFISQLVRSLAQSQADATGRLSMAAQEHTVSGEFVVVGPGEARYDLVFPVIFTEMPAFYYGARLPADERLISGKMPTVSALMFNWIIEERPSSGMRLHKGCTLGVVVTGPIGTKAIVNWSLSGICIPTAHLDS